MTRNFIAPLLENTFLALMLVGLLSGCGVDKRTGDPVTTFDLAGLMENYADNVIIPNYQQLRVAADAFSASGALANHCAALGTPQEAATRAATQAEWRSLVSAIEKTDMHAVGPVQNNDGLLLNRLNSFHSGELSACGVDQASVQNLTEPAFDIQAKPVNQRGIGALEFLLFNEDLTFSCPGSVSQTAEWNALTADQQKTLRCDYAQVVLDDITQAAQAVDDAWSPSAGDYRATFLSPSSLSENFNALSDALFALEKETKDKKLGTPFGIHSDCSALACPDRLESPLSENSLANIEANLQSFRQLFFGRDGADEEGLGFDDLIIANGHESVVDSLAAAIEDATAFVVTLVAGGSLLDLSEAIVLSGDNTACINSNANPDTVQSAPGCALHGYVKRITDILRTDFLVAVNLDLPDSAQGDND